MQCLPSQPNEFATFVRNLIEEKRRFIEDHRFDMSEIYSDEFEEEMKAIPDPKKEPIECLDQFLAILDEFGAWGADRAALNLIMQIEKLKIKTPYERHYLLLCLVSTTLIQVRAHCDHVFGQLPTEKERIETYSSQKVIRLLDVLRQFKPPDTTPIAIDSDKPPSAFVDRHETALNALNFSQTATNIETTMKNVKSIRPEFGHITDALTKIAAAHSPNAAISNGIRSLPPHRTRNSKSKRTPFQRTPRQHHNNHHHQNDPDALCGLIFCNSKFIAKILYSLCYEASRNDPDLNFLMVQYTVDRAADPITESKQADNEHRRQEEVLKRFRMHSCNLLIGTSVLEEGIELPKCNLVIRWDPPNTYRSYVQCKGRARSQNAQHIIMVAPANTYTLVPATDSAVPNNQIDEIECSDEEDSEVMTSTTTVIGDGVALMEAETETIVKRLAQFMHIEQILIRKCNNREPISTELYEADRFTACIQPYQPRRSETESGGPSVNLATAILLINKYCAKLPSDTFTKLTPLWRCAKTIRNGKEYFQYTVRLPINSPVKQDILVRGNVWNFHFFLEINVILVFEQGLPMPTSILARRMAAMIACKVLHQSGELDDSLQPIGKEVSIQAPTICFRF